MHIAGRKFKMKKIIRKVWTVIFFFLYSVDMRIANFCWDLVIYQSSISANFLFNDVLSDLDFKQLVWFWKHVDPLQIKRIYHIIRHTDLTYSITRSSKFTWFTKTLVNWTNIHDLQPLSIKWYCNYDFPFNIYLVTLWVIIFSANSKTIQNLKINNLKRYFPLKFQRFRIALLHHPWLALLILEIQFFKFCSLSFRCFDLNLTHQALDLYIFFWAF